jgi:hypothetical protein
MLDMIDELEQIFEHKINPKGVASDAQTLFDSGEIEPPAHIEAHSQSEKSDCVMIKICILKHSK